MNPGLAHRALAILLAAAGATLSLHNPHALALNLEATAALHALERSSREVLGSPWNPDY